MLIIRARSVLPMTRPALDDGAVVVGDKRIVEVGRWRDISAHHTGRVVDVGEAIVLPGLINAHCHLDYTAMAGQIPPPKRFTDWIKAIVALKAAWSYSEFAASWLEGARMLLRSGTTTLVDIEAVPELLPELWGVTPLRVISLREIINLRPRAAVREGWQNTMESWDQLATRGGEVGLSPHAPYSTTSEVLALAAEAAQQRSWLLATHIAESEEEFEMFMYRHGPLFEWLKGQRDMSDCGHGSPIQALARCGYLQARPLAVHVNYLWRDDAKVLGRAGVSVIHCPRSHAYFRHLLFPRTELVRAGVNICLGTDSLASVTRPRNEVVELDLFAEMQVLAANAPDLSPAEILRMVTVNAAAALGRRTALGQLAAGAEADLIVVPCDGLRSDPYATAVQHRGPVLRSMIGGRWVYGGEPG